MPWVSCNFTAFQSVSDSTCREIRLMMITQLRVVSWSVFSSKNVNSSFVAELMIRNGFSSALKYSSEHCLIVLYLLIRFVNSSVCLVNMSCCASGMPHIHNSECDDGRSALAEEMP